MDNLPDHALHVTVTGPFSDTSFGHRPEIQLRSEKDHSCRESGRRWLETGERGLMWSQDNPAADRDRNLGGVAGSAVNSDVMSTACLVAPITISESVNNVP